MKVVVGILAAAVLAVSIWVGLMTYYSPSPFRHLIIVPADKVN